MTTIQQAILQRLAEACELSEEVRFGQLVDFVGLIAAGERDLVLADIEDEEFLAALEEYNRNMQERRSMTSNRIS